MSKKAFVITPITAHPERYKNSKHFRHVFEYLLQPALEGAGYEAVYPQAEGSTVIHEEIIQNLETADLVMCDMSQLNPNVFFELGIRTALNKPVCMIRDEKTPEIPFDTNMINCHQYSSEMEVWEIKKEIELLTSHIKSTVKKNDKSNALWEVFGLKSQGSPTEAIAKNKDLRLLQLENEVLTSKLKKAEISQEVVESEMVSHHKCSHCGYGFSVDGYYPHRYYSSTVNTNSLIGIGVIHGAGEPKNTIQCPNCGNRDVVG